MKNTLCHPNLCSNLFPDACIQGQSRVLKECMIKKAKNVDQHVWSNLWILEAKVAMPGLFLGNIVLL